MSFFIMVVIIRRALVVVVVTVLVTFFDVPYANAELSFLPFLSAWGGITRYCDDLLFVALLYFYRIVKNFRRTNDVDSDHDDFDDNCAKNCPPFDLNVSSRAVVVVCLLLFIDRFVVVLVTIFIVSCSCSCSSSLSRDHHIFVDGL